MASRIEENQPNHASGDHQALTPSESGVELKTLLKLIDNEIEMAPATDEEQTSSIQNLVEKLSFSSAPVSTNFSTSRFKMSPTTTSEVPVPGFITLSETLLVPVKKYPKYNFVGRILGPRGMTVKQLEKETGCKIFVRGRASSLAANPICKSKARPACNNFNPMPPKPSLSNISKCALTEDPLHVYIECYDSPALAEQKMTHAVGIIQDLLSPPADGKDELKRQQLVDISLINGTYRATSASSKHVRYLHRGRPSFDLTSHPSLESQSCVMEHDGMIGPQMPQAHGDLGAVYGIAQQRRVWQKPRGPDSTTEEYAKSVSSREFVTDIVSKNKNSPMKNPSTDSLFNLPESVVTETMKVAQNLLASHKHLTSDRNKEHHHHQNPPIHAPQLQTQHTSRHLQMQQNQSARIHVPRRLLTGAGDFGPPRLPDFSIPPPPIMTPPLMAPPLLPPPTPSQIYRQYGPPMDHNQWQMCYLFPTPSHFEASRRF